MSKKDMYYHIEEDLEAYPDAVFYFIIGGRATGKTYSTLKWCVENNKKFVFIKRLAKDVDTMCGSNRPNRKIIFEADNSPMKPINRDLGTNFQACKVSNGLGGFYEIDEQGFAIRQIGYIVSLAEVATIRGFDMSDADIIIYDEFIPQVGERGIASAGDAFLNVVRTVLRDRPERGLKTTVICLANANSLDNPVMETMDKVTELAIMDRDGIEYQYDKERKILIHRIEDHPEWKSAVEQSDFYQAVKGTTWAGMAYDNTFAYDDVSDIEMHVNTREWTPIWRVKYKDYKWIAWVNEKDQRMVVSRTDTNKDIHTYDFNVNASLNLWYRSEDYTVLTNLWDKGRVKFSDYVARNRLIYTGKWFTNDLR